MKLLSRIILTLFLLQVGLFFLSWILYVVGMPINSLLSAAGLRWFFGSCISNFLSPILVWMILLFMAYGTFCKAGFRWQPSGYRNRAAWRIVGVLFCIIVTIMLLLTITPHAILLSVIGTFFPSPFATSILPVIAFSIIGLSLVYGFITGSISGLSDALCALSGGISQGAPFLVLYIFAMEFYHSILYVFG